MSGHSKWANIKRKKEATDKVKGAVFAKLSRLITLAVTEGGGMPDPEHNFKLRLIVDKAKSLNMPKENIERAIEKASGGDKTLFKEAMYEGFGPHGVAILVYATTDNPNRTVNEIKNCFEQYGGKLGAQGAVSYLFTKCGLVEFDMQSNSEEDVFNFAQSMDAIDIDKIESSYYVYIPFDHFGKIKEHLNTMKPTLSEVDYKPTTSITLSDENQIQHAIKLIEALEELDDVHKVFFNLNV